MRLLVLSSSLIFLLIGCNKAQGDKLSDYSAQYPQSSEWLIACAAGDKDGFADDEKNPISIFFYPEDGATDYKYFATKKLDDDPTDFSNYKEYEGLQSEDVFNGYLKKFKVSSGKEHWGIVTYLANDSLRVSDPIKILHKTSETETDQNLITITENGLEPMFAWTDGTHKENVIYFQVIADKHGNLVSGTYTINKFFNFYDLTNVVINIKEFPVPFLDNGEHYTFTLMAVSDDNWVNVAATKEFTTN